MYTGSSRISKNMPGLGRKLTARFVALVMRDVIGMQPM